MMLACGASNRYAYRGTAPAQVFTVSCFAAPAVVNTIGARCALSLGVLGYASLVGASLLLSTVGSGPAASPAAVAACRAAVVCGGGLLGAGASLLWTAQGALGSCNATLPRCIPTNSAGRLNQTHAVTHDICGLCVTRSRLHSSVAVCVKVRGSELQ